MTGFDFEGVSCAEHLEEALDGCNGGVEVGHVGDHLGMSDAMKEPCPTAAEVRAHFMALTEAQQCAGIQELLECPW